MAGGSCGTNTLKLRLWLMVWPAESLTVAATVNGPPRVGAPVMVPVPSLMVTVLVAGIVIPTGELVGLIWLLSRVIRPNRDGLVIRTRVYRIMHRLVRWPMVIPFIAAIAAGTLDARFGDGRGGVVRDGLGAQGVALQPDGKIVVGGCGRRAWDGDAARVG